MEVGIWWVVEIVCRRRCDDLGTQWHACGKSYATPLHSGAGRRRGWYYGKPHWSACPHPVVRDTVTSRVMSSSAVLTTLVWAWSVISSSGWWRCPSIAGYVPSGMTLSVYNMEEHNTLILSFISCLLTNSIVCMCFTQSRNNQWTDWAHIWHTGSLTSKVLTSRPEMLCNAP